MKKYSPYLAVQNANERLLTGWLRLRLSGLLLLLSCCCGSELAKAQDSWQSVNIGAGGWVQALYTHPLEKDLAYIRSDVGGAYRWDANKKEWIDISFKVINNYIHEKYTPEEGYYNISAFALDPKDVNTVYMITGPYIKSWYNNIANIFKSTDRGKSWVRITPSWDVKGGSNEDATRAGERLVVDPNNSSVLLYGSNNKGLWRSADAGASWSRVPTINGIVIVNANDPDDGGNAYGVTSVAFDKNIPGRVYASVWKDGVYQSDDSGLNWTKLSGSPTEVLQMRVAGNGTVWTSHKDGVGKYKNSSWTNYQPEVKRFCGLAINPFDDKQVLAITGIGSLSNWSENIYLTSDEGESWNIVNWKINRTVPWINDDQFKSTPTAATFDPYTNGRVWVTTGVGVYRSENIAAEPVLFAPVFKGQDMLVFFDIAAPPGMPLLTGVGDESGYLHDNGVENFPSKKLTKRDATAPMTPDTYQFAYSEAKASAGYPAKLARCISQRDWGGYGSVMISTDGGVSWQASKTWTKQNTQTNYPNKIAMAPTDVNNMVVNVGGNKAEYTIDGGANWNTVTGLPNGITGYGSPYGLQGRQPLVADKVTNGTFYYINVTDTQTDFYRSSDKGANFSLISSIARGAVDFYKVETPFGMAAGEVWVGLGKGGLHRSSDGGASWNAVASVSNVQLFAFGKPKPGNSNPTLFVIGKVNEVEGVFISDDLGGSWRRLDDANNLVLYAPTNLAASREVYGQVFIGTNGRGAFYNTPNTTVADATAPTAPAELTAATKTVYSVSLAWKASTDEWGVVKYEIYQGNTRVGTSNATTYTVRGLAANTGYTFTVKAFDAKGNVSAASNVLQVTTNPVPPPPVNKLLNGNFSNGTSPWELSTFAPGGAEASLIQVDASAKVDIANGGSDAWMVGLIQGGFTLSKDVKYAITFDAKASEAKTIYIEIKSGTAIKWAAFNISVGTSYQKYTYQYTPTEDLSDCSFAFYVGSNNKSVWVDNASILEEVENESPGEVTTTPGTPLAANKIQNGDFSDGVSPWSLYTNSIGGGSLVVENGAANVGITEGGDAGWKVQLSQGGFALTQGTTYIISFDARADAAKSVSIQINSNGDYKWGQFEINLTSTYQRYTYQYTPNADLTNCVLAFNFGGNNIGSWVDNVSILPESESNTTITALRNGEGVISKGKAAGLYPNPAREHFNLAYSGERLPASVRVVISNQPGAVVYDRESRFDPTTQLLRVPTQGLGSGVYQVQVISGSHSQVHRLVISK